MNAGIETKKEEAAVQAKQPTDLASFLPMQRAQEEGLEIELRHPGSGAGLGIFVTVYGPDSTRAQEARRAMFADRVSAAQTRDMKPQEVLKETCLALARMTSGWRGMVEEGREVKWTEAAAAEIFLRYPFIREQVDAAAASRATFIKT